MKAYSLCENYVNDSEKETRYFLLNTRALASMDRTKATRTIQLVGEEGGVHLHLVDFFFAMCFIQFFEVSTFRFWQVTGSNRVPWGLFLAVFTYNLDVKAYSRIFFLFSYPMAPHNLQRQINTVFHIIRTQKIQWHMYFLV